MASTEQPPTRLYRYELWHNLSAKFLRGFQPGDYVWRGYRGTIEVPGDQPQACEAIFARHNQDDRPDGSTAPSLSVGDVVRMHVAAMGWAGWTCLSTGWRGPLALDDDDYARFTPSQLTYDEAYDYVAVGGDDRAQG